MTKTASGSEKFIVSVFLWDSSLNTAPSSFCILAGEKNLWFKFYQSSWNEFLRIISGSKLHDPFPVNVYLSPRTSTTCGKQVGYRNEAL